MSSIDASYDGVILLRNEKTVDNSDGQKIVRNRNTEIVIQDANGKERPNHKLPYGSRLHM
jgi:hypothetical protein